MWVGSLCPYFLLILIALVFSPIIWAGKTVGKERFLSFGVGVWLALVVLLIGFLEYEFFIWAWGADGWTGVLAVIGVHGLFFLGAWGFLKTISIADDWWNWRQAGKPVKSKPVKIKKPREPNLLYEYLKAKKRRVCPLLEWV